MLISISSNNTTTNNTRRTHRARTVESNMRIPSCSICRLPRGAARRKVALREEDADRREAEGKGEEVVVASLPRRRMRSTVAAVVVPVRALEVTMVVSTIVRLREREGRMTRTEPMARKMSLLTMSTKPWPRPKKLLL